MTDALKIVVSAEDFRLENAQRGARTWASKCVRRRVPRSTACC